MHPAKIRVGSRLRQKLDPKEIAALADSIKQSGLLQPILVTESGDLIAGLRRLEAWKTLYPDEPIPTHTFNPETDSDQLRAEFAENHQRSNFTWQETAVAISRYHELLGGTVTKTAEALSLTKAWISINLTVHKKLEEVSHLDSLKTAYNLISRGAERQQQAADSSIIHQLRASLKETPPEENLPEKPPEGVKKAHLELLQEDFLSWAPAYSGVPFNLLHCDFPYGLEMHNAGSSAATFDQGGYLDSFDTYVALLECLKANQDRFLEPNAHIVFWFSPKHWYYTQNVLSRELGWNVAPFPLIWNRGNSGIAPNTQRDFRRTYETAFFCTRGDRKLVRTGPSVVNWCVERDYHPSQKPVTVLGGFFCRLVDKSTRFLDPTCGSASALIAARAFGAQQVLGLESNEIFLAKAKQNILNTSIKDVPGEVAKLWQNY